MIKNRFVAGLILAALMLSMVSFVSAQGFTIPEIGEGVCAYKQPNGKPCDENTQYCAEGCPPLPKKTEPAKEETKEPTAKETTTEPAKEEVTNEEVNELKEGLQEAISSGSLEQWFDKLEEAEKKAEAAGQTSVLSELRELKKRAGGERPSTRAERFFRTVTGRTPGREFPAEYISPLGYPTTTFFSGYRAEGGQLEMIIEDGKLYVIDLGSGAQALFEGLGPHAGEEIIFPPINPSGLSISGGTGSKIDGEIRGKNGDLSDVIESASVESIIDPETGEEKLIPKVKLKENAPEGTHEMELVLERDGEIVAAIPFVVDTNKVRPARKPLSPAVKAAGAVAGLAAAAGLVAWRLMAAKKGK